MTHWATWLPPVETRVGATDTDEVEFGVIRIDRSHLNRFDIICNLQGSQESSCTRKRWQITEFLTTVGLLD